MKVIRSILISVVLLALFFGTLLGAILQESYRLNPPTQAEIEQHPILTRIFR